MRGEFREQWRNTDRGQSAKHSGRASLATNEAECRDHQYQDADVNLNGLDGERTPRESHENGMRGVQTNGKEVREGDENKKGRDDHIPNPCSTPRGVCGPACVG